MHGANNTSDCSLIEMQNAHSSSVFPALQVSEKGAATISKMKSLVTVNILGCHSLTAGAKELISGLIQRDFGY